jgi:hypothetical protein
MEQFIALSLAGERTGPLVRRALTPFGQLTKYGRANGGAPLPQTPAKSLEKQ